MIDIHTHILPNVDDGAENSKVSLLMLELEKKAGVKTIILTPHSASKHNYDRIINEFNSLQKKTDLKLYLGSEILYSDNLFKELSDNLHLTINNSKVILVELPFYNEPFLINDFFYNIIGKGYTPILAHPERYSYLKTFQIEKLKQIGVLIQINSCSLFRQYGSKVKKRAKRLLREELVDFIATDCHHPSFKEINLDKAHHFIRGKFGDDYAKRIFEDNPDKLLQKIE